MPSLIPHAAGDVHGAATWRQQSAEHHELYKSQRQVANAGAFQSSNIGRQQTFEVGDLHYMFTSVDPAIMLAIVTLRAAQDAAAGG